MKGFFGLLISSVLVLLVTMYLLSDPQALASLKPYVRFMWIIVTPIITMSIGVINIASSVIDNDELKSRELENLTPKITVLIRNLWTLLGFYILTSLFAFLVTFLKIKDTDLELVLVSLSLSFIYMSLFSFFKIYAIYTNIISLKANLNQRKIKRKEIEKAVSRLEEEEAELSAEDKNYYEKQNKIIKVKETKRN
ncbi:hypothetical protein [Shewanella baltica]|uniref:hypothetical protein n=1 Tax=Shewanella baltica TaxID=62322 RepID=UPI002167476C|nr:hypothetical protein [Shewanella baltica]MCS6116611.1 hypothetical protein [Shewanella baltica]UVW66408.1 hypothetical protein HHE93_22995 [Shewanella baltica]